MEEFFLVFLPGLLVILVVMAGTVVIVLPLICWVMHLVTAEPRNLYGLTATQQELTNRIITPNSPPKPRPFQGSEEVPLSLKDLRSWCEKELEKSSETKTVTEFVRAANIKDFGADPGVTENGIAELFNACRENEPVNVTETSLVFTSEGGGINLLVPTYPGVLENGFQTAQHRRTQIAH